MNIFVIAITNGKKDIHRYVLLSICGSLLSLIVISLLTASYGLTGALIALAVNQGISLVATVLVCRSASWFNIGDFFGYLNPQAVKNIFSYMVMALVSAAVIPLSHIIIRNYLGRTQGWEAAGYWDAMWRMSSVYLLFVTSALGFYFLPRLSELTSRESIRSEIFQGFRVLLPTVGSAAAAVYVFREALLTFLFSESFLPISEVLFWQLLGDVIKITSWLLAYIIVAKRMIITFVANEIIFSMLFVAAIYLITPYFGLQATGIAHLFTQLIYLCIVYWQVKRAKFI
jgi:PST family polysaccharide transporter